MPPLRGRSQRPERRQRGPRRGWPRAGADRPRAAAASIPARMHADRYGFHFGAQPWAGGRSHDFCRPLSVGRRLLLLRLLLRVGLLLLLRGVALLGLVPLMRAEGAAGGGPRHPMA